MKFVDYGKAFDFIKRDTVLNDLERLPIQVRQCLKETHKGGTAQTSKWKVNIM